MKMRLFVLLAALGCALVAAGVGGAATHVSGEWAVTDEGIPDCGPIGASQVLLRCETTGFLSEYSGSLTGTSTVSFVTFIDCRGGRAMGYGTETFTGTVAGVGSGTLTWGIRFTSDFDCNTFGLSNFEARTAITSGTGDLASLRGTLVFGDTTYEGDLH
jgi:hypothetical protein